MKKRNVSIRKAVVSAGMSLILISGFFMGSSAEVNAAPGEIKTVNLGTGVIEGYNGAGGSAARDKYDHIYFGTYNGNPVENRVLAISEGNGAGSSYVSKDGQTVGSENALLLLSESSLGQTMFNNTYNNNEYDGSILQSWMSDYYTNSFTASEQNAVLSTTTTNDAFVEIGWYDYRACNLNGDHVFALSGSELTNPTFGFSTGGGSDSNRSGIPLSGSSSYMWWIRSAYTYGGAAGTGDAGHISSGGVCSGGGANSNYYARPSYNLNKEEVLFTMPADQVKASTLAVPGDYDTKSWRLTLLDDGQELVLGNGTVKNMSGSTEITVPYTYSSTGMQSTKVSVMITDKSYTDPSASIKQYGQLAEITDRQISFTLPADFDQDNDKIYIFAETNQGVNRTDYASQPQELKFVEGLEVTNIVSGDIPDTAADFTFQMTAVNDEPMPVDSTGGVTTVSITGNGTAIFGATLYNQPGTYEYQISQVAGTKPEYTYDDKVYNVSVIVSEISGELQITDVLVDGVTGRGVTFNNIYKKNTGTQNKPSKDGGSNPQKSQSQSNVKGKTVSVKSAVKTGDDSVSPYLLIGMLLAASGMIIVIQSRRRIGRR